MFSAIIFNLKNDKRSLAAAEHNNILIGHMDVETLSHGRKLMRRQKEGSRALNIRSAFILVPVALESQALQVIGSGTPYINEYEEYGNYKGKLIANICEGWSEDKVL